MSTRSYYLSFVNYLDPNVKSGFKEWPQWKQGKKLLNFYPLFSTIINDDFRDDTYQYILNNADVLRI